jgi:hypothetical protein
MRLYSAICSAIEAWPERTRTDTLEAEMEAADWAASSSMLDDD